MRRLQNEGPTGWESNKPTSRELRNPCATVTYTIRPMLAGYQLGFTIEDLKLLGELVKAGFDLSWG